MSENGVNQALRRMGYETGEMTAHGFRAMAATLLNEMGRWNPDAIERQLAHQEVSSVRRAYARGEYWDERVAMMQDWSDYLDGLRDEAEVTRPARTAPGKAMASKSRAGRGTYRGGRISKPRGYHANDARSAYRCAFDEISLSPSP